MTDREALLARLAATRVRLAPSPIHGVGVFAVREIAKGEDPFASGGVVEKYSPDQPRDEQGQWTSGGGNAGGSAPSTGVPFSASAFHGSSSATLHEASSAPNARQFDNATSQFGAFVTLSRQEAERYAGKAGTVYRATVSLANPYVMPWGEFAYFQDQTHGSRDVDGFRGKALPPSAWAARGEALKAEALALRQDLERKGHDGIVVTTRGGRPEEIVSFRSVPVAKYDPDEPRDEQGQWTSGTSKTTDINYKPIDVPSIHYKGLAVHAKWNNPESGYVILHAASGKDIGTRPLKINEAKRAVKYLTDRLDWTAEASALAGNPDAERIVREVNDGAVKVRRVKKGEESNGHFAVLTDAEVAALPAPVRTLVAELGARDEVVKSGPDRPRTVWLDLDGVLADFDAAATRLLGLPPGDAEARCGSDAFWADLRAGDPEFYRHLPVTADANALWDCVVALARSCGWRVAVLTGVPKSWPGAADQKRAWVEERFPGVEVVTTTAARKAEHARPGDVLVDDRPRYRDRWEAAGGVFVPHVSAEESLAALEALAASELVAKASTSVSSEVPQSAQVAPGRDFWRGVAISLRGWLGFDLVAKYSDDQPREPAGSPSGGQWSTATEARGFASASGDVINRDEEHVAIAEQHGFASIPAALAAGWVRYTRAGDGLLYVHLRDDSKVGVRNAIGLVRDMALGRVIVDMEDARGEVTWSRLFPDDRSAMAALRAYRIAKREPAWHLPASGLLDLPTSAYLNASSRPNLATDDGGTTFRALRPVEPGEELTLDYAVAKYDPDQPRDERGRWAGGESGPGWITSDGTWLPVSTSGRTDDKSQWGAVPGWAKAETHKDVVLTHGIANEAEAVRRGWLRVTGTQGSFAFVQFDGGNAGARRRAAAYVRDAFDRGAVRVTIDRGDRSGNFTEIGPAMRFVHGTAEMKKIAKADAAKGAMVAVRLPPDVTRELALPGGEPSARLHLTLLYLGEAASISEATLAALRAGLEEALARVPPFAVRVSGYGRFAGVEKRDDVVREAIQKTCAITGWKPSDMVLVMSETVAKATGEDVVWLSVDAPELEGLREAVVTCARAAGIDYPQEHGFTPHVSIGFSDDDALVGRWLDALDVAFSSGALDDLEILVDRVALVVGGEVTEVPLGSALDDEDIEDALDLAQARHVVKRARERGERPIPWAEVRARLDALDEEDLVHKYDENEPRDDRGRWTDGGSGDTPPGGAPGDLPDRVAEPVSQFERAHARADRETLRAVGPDGAVLLHQSGDRGTVALSPEQIRSLTGVGAVFTHNHPGGSGFSLDDIRLSARLGAAEIRVVTPQGTTYRMAPPATGWPSDAALRELYRVHEAATYARLRPEVDAGRMSKEDASRLHYHLVWAGAAADLGLRYAREGWRA